MTTPTLIDILTLVSVIISGLTLGITAAMTRRHQRRAPGETAECDGGAEWHAGGAGQCDCCGCCQDFGLAGGAARSAVAAFFGETGYLSRRMTGMGFKAALLTVLLSIGGLAWTVSPVSGTEDITLSKRVFLLFDMNELRPLGTAFRICSPSLILTAAHVIDGYSSAEEVGVISTHSSPVRLFSLTRIEKHPAADVAALFIDEEKATQAELECFNLGIPSNDYTGYSDYPLAETILAYGFPILPAIPGEEPPGPRMMKGHIQSKRQYGGYTAYELAFPAFNGMSGSPVFRDAVRNTVVGIVTASVSYFSSQDRTRPRSDWALGAALPPLTEWIRSLENQTRGFIEEEEGTIEKEGETAGEAYP